jgi:hypothetical protein
MHGEIFHAMGTKDAGQLDPQAASSHALVE